LEPEKVLSNDSQAFGGCLSEPAGPELAGSVLLVAPVSPLLMGDLLPVLVDFSVGPFGELFLAEAGNLPGDTFLGFSPIGLYLSSLMPGKHMSVVSSR